MLVTLNDAIATFSNKPKYCRKGIRAFCDKYGLDYQNFRNNGIDSQILIDLNDSMGLQVVEVARGRKQ